MLFSLSHGELTNIIGCFQPCWTLITSFSCGYRNCHSISQKWYSAWRGAEEMQRRGWKCGLKSWGGCWDKALQRQLWKSPHLCAVTVTHRQQLLQRGVLTSHPWISRHRLKETHPLALSAFGLIFCAKTRVLLTRGSLLVSRELCPACTWIWWYQLEYTLPTSHLKLLCNGFGEAF